MTTASLELCKELYELSGWMMESNMPYFYYDHNHNYALTMANTVVNSGLDNPPAYDLGYLLRKLPVFIPKHNGLTLIPYVDGKWEIYYDAPKGVKDVRAFDDTPEDAACKLAIELFKQGVLK